jgi:hypothetical protein
LTNFVPYCYTSPHRDARNVLAGLLGFASFSGSSVVSVMNMIGLAALVYFALNFFCALVLHVHGERQAHLPPRFLDIFVHFALMTAFAIPVLLVVTAEAMFGGKEPVRVKPTAKVPAVGARAA